ncbi:STAS domain-containing protein [Streptomyces sp. NPDC048507]|uniref:STAS domain-containing protein n=1 Tax=Streptomyces sp. NPDC048507 TaxID=3365560 RepID=UPI003721DC64
MTTTPPPVPLTLTPAAPDAADGRGVTLALEGDLDHETYHLLLEAVERELGARPDARHLRLDCAGLLMCDSMGLSALLMVRRRTNAAGVALHLDGRRPPLERLLTLTGTLEHLTGAPVRTVRDDRLGREHP